MAELDLSSHLREARQAAKNMADSMAGSVDQTKNLNDAVSQGATGVKNLRNQTKLATLGFANFNRILSIVRSRMLIIAFASSKTIGVLNRLAKQGARVESMARAFDTLSGSAQKSRLAMRRLQEATNGTMSQMDLLKQANNAMVLGVSKNSKEMAEMFDIAQRLGRALGQDTAKSVESLITGIGRQSRLMLDNIGIIVKSDEAYEKYAEKIGTTASKLTDAEKKQAFFNATMESAREKVETLGDETLTSQDVFDQFGTAAEDFGIAIGKFVLPVFVDMLETITPVITGINDFFHLMKHGPPTFNPFEDWADSIPDNIEAVEKELNVLKQQRQALLKTNEDTKETVKSNEQLGESFEILGMHTENTANGIITVVGQGADELAAYTLAHGVTKESMDAFYLAQTNATEGVAEFAENIDTINPTISDLEAKIAHLVDLLKVLRGATDNSKDGLQEWAKGFEKEFVHPIMQGWGMATETANMYFQSVQQGFAQEMRELKKSEEFQNMSRERQRQEIKKLENSQRQGKQTAFKQQKALTMANIVMSTAEAIINALTVKPLIPTGYALAGFAGTMGAAQLAIASKQKMPAFATGGDFITAGPQAIMVGDNPGGRERVQVTPLSSPNIAGPQGGSVTVNISGNIMSQDYVEEVLSDQIKEAVRRGSDFGIG